MPLPCVVRGCKNSARHRFPKDEIRKKKWIQAIKYMRSGFTIKKNTAQICAAHFVRADLKITPTAFTKLDQAPKILKREAVPSIFPWSSEKLCHGQNPEENASLAKPFTFDKSKVGRTYSRTPPISFVEIACIPDTDPEGDEDSLKVKEDKASQDKTKITWNLMEINEYQILPSDFGNLVEISMEKESLDQRKDEVYSGTVLAADESTFSIHYNSDSEYIVQFKEEVELEAVQKHLQSEIDSGFSIHNNKDPEYIEYYTGLENIHKFMLVYNSLGDANNLIYKCGCPPKTIDSLEQFFITLIILRNHNTFEEAALLFRISPTHVYSIFTTWISFMAFQWKNMKLCVETDCLKTYISIDLGKEQPDTKLTPNITESSIIKPEPELALMQQIPIPLDFSTSKNRTKVNYLIGIQPGGMISYVSPPQTKLDTDRETLGKSAVLKRFDYDDVLDRLEPYYEGKVDRSFFNKGKIGSGTSCRKGASYQSSTERIIIDMMKTYKILTEPMNQAETLISSDIVFVIAMLINFKCIPINKNA